jgi:hypothetical protein
LCYAIVFAPLCSPGPLGVAWVAQVASCTVRIVVDALSVLALLASLALFL